MGSPGWGRRRGDDAKFPLPPPRQPGPQHRSGRCRCGARTGGAAAGGAAWGTVPPPPPPPPHACSATATAPERSGAGRDRAGAAAAAAGNRGPGARTWRGSSAPSRSPRGGITGTGAAAVFHPLGLRRGRLCSRLGRGVPTRVHECVCPEPCAGGYVPVPAGGSACVRVPAGAYARVGVSPRAHACAPGRMLSGWVRGGRQPRGPAGRCHGWHCGAPWGERRGGPGIVWSRLCDTGLCPPCHVASRGSGCSVQGKCARCPAGTPCPAWQSPQCAVQPPAPPLTAARRPVVALGWVPSCMALMGALC